MRTIGQRVVCVMSVCDYIFCDNSRNKESSIRSGVKVETTLLISSRKICPDPCSTPTLKSSAEKMSTTSDWILKWGRVLESTTEHFKIHLVEWEADWRNCIFSPLYILTSTTWRTSRNYIYRDSDWIRRKMTYPKITYEIEHKREFMLTQMRAFDTNENIENGQCEGKKCKTKFSIHWNAHNN